MKPIQSPWAWLILVLWLSAPPPRTVADQALRRASAPPSQPHGDHPRASSRLVAGAELLRGTESGALEVRPLSPVDLPQLQTIIRKFVLATSGVLTLAVALLFCVKRWMDRKNGLAHRGQRIQVRSTASLGARCVAQLLEVDEQLILVGRDASGIRSMITLPRPFQAELDEVQEFDRFTAEVQ